MLMSMSMPTKNQMKTLKTPKYFHALEMLNFCVKIILNNTMLVWNSNDLLEIALNVAIIFYF
jgi:hypothetical protein